MSLLVLLVARQGFGRMRWWEERVRRRDGSGGETC